MGWSLEVREEEHARKSTFAYSFHAVDSTSLSVAPSLLTLMGPNSMSAPSNDEHPGPPLSLQREAR